MDGYWLLHKVPYLVVLSRYHVSKAKTSKLMKGPRVVGGTGYQLTGSNLVTPSFDKGTHEIADRPALLDFSWCTSDRVINHVFSK